MKMTEAEMIKFRKAVDKMTAKVNSLGEQKREEFFRLLKETDEVLSKAEKEDLREVQTKEQKKR